MCPTPQSPTMENGRIMRQKLLSIPSWAGLPPRDTLLGRGAASFQLRALRLPGARLSSVSQTGQETPVSLPPSCLVACQLSPLSLWFSLPQPHKELDTTERLHFHFSPSCIGEGNGNPLQCSCLENPRDGGAWWAAVYGVAQSRT